MRRTKLEALATQDGILDAAELVFQQHGVSRASLEDIASAAGVTRGAIYWHFEDKPALFRAMVERVRLPFEGAVRSGELASNCDPLTGIRRWLLCGISALETQPSVRRVTEILMLKMEHVDEMLIFGKRHLAARKRFIARVEPAIRMAIDWGHLACELRPGIVALGLWAAIDGLVRNWLLDPGAFNLSRTASQVIDAYLSSLLRPRSFAVGTRTAARRAPSRTDDGIRSLPGF
jgi:TetR/AcrR family acrAB operon transcriptional repressor